MCKNLFIIGVKPGEEQQKKLWQFVTTMAPILTQNDRDGIGYAAMSNKGIFGERWYNPEDAFKYNKQWIDKQAELKKSFKGSTDVGKKYNYFSTEEGAPSEPVVSLIMHARMATCEKSLENIHPFVRNDMALIHNGVINNTEQLKNITSTCDSECILNCYIDNKVNEIPENIEKVGKELRGGYACAVLAKNADEVPILDVFRNNPSLYAMNVFNIGTVICTVPQMVVDACDKLGWKLSTSYRIKDSKLIRFNAITGQIISSHAFRDYFYNPGYWTGDDYYKGHNRNYQYKEKKKQCEPDHINGASPISEEEEWQQEISDRLRQLYH